MTAPDLLQSVLDAFPGELRLRQRGTGLVLQVTSPRLSGSLFASSRADIEDIARAYEAMRNRQRHGPHRCACGLLYGEHAWDERAASKRGACPDRPGRYQPEASSE